MRFTSIFTFALVLFVSDPLYANEPPRGDHAPFFDGDLTLIAEPVPALVSVSSAGNRTPYEVNGKSYTVLASSVGYKERGIASWYGMKFHGKLTSNGEIYDVFQLSAAHKTLPIPCFARVTNLRNNRSVVVRINDRGPFVDNRILDLSWVAAAKLGFVDQGLTEVELEVITPEPGLEYQN